jgi:CubicO group peptidase (beta-lactamase class C family)
MYETGASATGALIALATGKSFGEALRERICDPLGMTETGFSVDGGASAGSRRAYDQDDARTVQD